MDGLGAALGLALQCVLAFPTEPGVCLKTDVRQANVSCRVATAKTSFAGAAGRHEVAQQLPNIIMPAYVATQRAPSVRRSSSCIRPQQHCVHQHRRA